MCDRTGEAQVTHGHANRKGRVLVRLRTSPVSQNKTSEYSIWYRWKINPFGREVELTQSKNNGRRRTINYFFKT